MSMLMILVMVIGVSGMMGQGGVPSTPLFLIPIYNSAQSIAAVFGGAYDSVAMTFTIVANVVTTAVLVWVLTRMFNSEKIMFNG